jgi:hypothetical protein
MNSFQRSINGKKKQQNPGEGVRGKAPLHTVGGNVNYCNHHGNLYGGSFKN